MHSSSSQFPIISEFGEERLLCCSCDPLINDTSVIQSETTNLQQRINSLTQEVLGTSSISDGEVTRYRADSLDTTVERCACKAGHRRTWKGFFKVKYLFTNHNWGNNFTAKLYIPQVFLTDLKVCLKW